MAPFPPPPSPPAGISERLSCSLAAAKRFQVPADVVLAVATVENGHPGLWAPNADGSFDLGAMQLNTRYIASLAAYGVRDAHVLASGCYAYMLAAWRLHGHLTRDRGDPWTRVANYNSRTPRFNLRYQARLAPAADAWRRWLAAYYPSMAQVGGAELPSPTLSADRLAVTWPTSALGHRSRILHSRPIGFVRSCGVACAPMRVVLTFHGAATPSEAAGSGG